VNEPEDALVGPDGHLYVTSGNTVIRFSGPDFGLREVLATADGETGAMALDPDGRLLVCVAGVGVLRIGLSGSTEVVCDKAEGGPVHCPTALAVAKDGTTYVTDGSTRHQGQRWVYDLMEQNSLGRLICVDSTRRDARVLEGALRYPSGIALTESEDAIILSEAWAHRIKRHGLNHSSADGVLRDNLPGYPGRLAPASDGQLWLAMFALRTQLVDFVLTQRDYVKAMMENIEPEYWIRPALSGLNSGLEPLQGGQVRKLGVIKPWAPPRSYGLVVKLEEDGHPVLSMHSRGGGKRHGVTSARQSDCRLTVAVRGGNQVLITELGGES